MRYLESKGIKVMQHYIIPCHKEKYFKRKFSLNKINLYETEKLYSEMMSLPCDPSHQIDEIKRVAFEIKNFFKNYANKKL